MIDYKTGRPKDEGALRADLQLRAYAVGFAQREQAQQVAIEFHYLQGAVTRVIADRAFLRKAHGHLSATAREPGGRVEHRILPAQAVAVAVPALRLPHRV